MTGYPIPASLPTTPPPPERPAWPGWTGLRDLGDHLTHNGASREKDDDR